MNGSGQARRDRSGKGARAGGGRQRSPENSVIADVAWVSLRRTRGAG